MSAAGVALVVGAGPALGAALCRRFAAAGMAVALAARGGEERAAGLGHERIRGYAVDARDEDQVAALFTRLEADLGVPDLVVYNAGAQYIGSILEIPAEMYQKVWRLCCLSGFLVGREAARRMTPRASGTILFTGATASLRGGAGFAAFAGGKFGLRALAQSMARELGPKGIHVAHVVIDGMIDAEAVRARFPERFAAMPEDGVLAPEAIAESYYQLHVQGRSAWAHEIDLRPWSEKF